MDATLQSGSANVRLDRAVRKAEQQRLGESVHASAARVTCKGAGRARSKFFLTTPWLMEPSRCTFSFTKLVNAVSLGGELLGNAGASGVDDRHERDRRAVWRAVARDHLVAVQPRSFNGSAKPGAARFTARRSRSRAVLAHPVRISLAIRTHRSVLRREGFPGICLPARFGSAGTL
jgi:hypothetical protein